VAAGADAMYVCGGVSVQKTALRDSHRLERVNSGAGTAWQWRRMPDVPRARIDAAATVVAGRVHVAGGWVGERKLPAPEHNVLVLDEEDGIWDEVAVHGTGAGELCAARYGSPDPPLNTQQELAALGALRPYCGVVVPS